MSRRTPFARRALAVSVLATLAGCFDGYPDADAPLLDPSRLTSDELLSELNELGERPHLSRRWRYALEDGCVLTVKVRRTDTGRREVPLWGATVGVRSGEVQTQVLLVPADEHGAPAVVVLETRRWTDTVLARSLLTHLERRCAAVDRQRLTWL